MSDSTYKILSEENLVSSLSNDDRNKVVFCFGHFNVIHPGHLRFLQQAKSLGKCLVVGVLQDSDLDEGQLLYLYNEQERAKGVAALEFVDLVVVVKKNTLSELVNKFKPSICLLGKEFEDTEDPGILKIIDSVKGTSGKILYGSGDINYAKVGLADDYTVDIEQSNLKEFSKVCKRNGIDFNKISEKTDLFDVQNIIVIGDSIVDQYIACDAVGMSAEAPVVVVRELESKEYIGGAGIVASHVSKLGANCHFVSIVGDDNSGKLITEKLQEDKVHTHLFIDDTRPTTYKIRYLVENQKLFRVSRLKEHSISKYLENKIIDKILDLAKQCDGIIFSDFVYGVITERLLNKIIEISIENNIKLFGDLQCSSQIGNVTKFRKFDLITPTEREARISLANHDAGIESIAQQLLNTTQANNLILKLGSEGFISYNNSNKKSIQSQHYPALISNPVDVAGAGDSLLASVAISLCAGIPIMEASAIGACVAALAVQTVGNIAISKAQLKNILRNLPNTV